MQIFNLKSDTIRTNLTQIIGPISLIISNVIHVSLSNLRNLIIIENMKQQVQDYIKGPDSYVENPETN